MGGVNLAEDSGLHSHAVAALDIDQLQGHAGVDGDAASEIAEVYYFLGHLLIIILCHPDTSSLSKSKSYPNTPPLTHIDPNII